MTWWTPEYACGDLRGAYRVGIISLAAALAILGAGQIHDFGDGHPFGISEIPAIPNEVVPAGTLAVISAFAFGWWLFGWKKINDTSMCQWSAKP